MNLRMQKPSITSQIDETALVKRLIYRLVPFLCLLYFVSYLDRVNVGFAALTMNSELRFSNTAFGAGASIFFVGYLIFEVPSNLILEKVGARKWIARIMVSWGIASMAMCLVKNEATFYVLRFTLGVAEAGFLPGILVYLNHWFPKEYRARITGLFFVAIPLSSVFGAPLSTLIMEYTNGWFGYSGWRWMFFLEGLPAVFLGFYCLRFLQDRPTGSTWVNAEEAAYLERVLLQERREAEAERTYTLWEAFSNTKVLLLASALLLIVSGAYGISFWMPQVLSSFVKTKMEVGFVTSGIYAATAIGMVLWTRRSDRTNERPIHTASALTFGGLCFIAAGFALDAPMLAIAFLGAACVSVFAAIPVFWSIPASFLTGTALAGGVAFINSLAQFGGIIAPYFIGVSKDMTGGFSIAMAGMGIALLAASALMLRLRRFGYGNIQGNKGSVKALR